MSLIFFGDLTISDIERYMRGLEMWAGWAAPLELLHDPELRHDPELLEGPEFADESAAPVIVKSAPSAPARQTTA